MLFSNSPNSSNAAYPISRLREPCLKKKRLGRLHIVEEAPFVTSSRDAHDVARLPLQLVVSVSDNFDIEPIINQDSGTHLAAKDSGPISEEEDSQTERSGQKALEEQPAEETRFQKVFQSIKGLIEQTAGMQIASTKTKESDPFAKEEVAEEECSHVRHGGEKTRGQKSPKEIRFQKAIQDIIEKLLHDSTHITKEDAQRLQNNPDRDIADHRAESIITAVEILASANERVHAGNSSNDAQIGLPSTTTQSTGTQKDSPVHAAPQPHAGLKTLREIATKVHAEIDANPTSVTTEDLRLFQNVVGKIQKTLGAVPAAVPHPDLEEEFQKEIAKIEPKVEQGTVTKEEADRLHSLESRAHGHTEKGGVTAQAQSVAAKRSRGLSISASHNTTTSNISVAVSRAHSAGQPHQGKETNLGNAAAGIQPKIGSAHETVANEDGNLQAQGATRKGRITTEAASLVDNNEGVSSA